jgi:hypothetical protein
MPICEYVIVCEWVDIQDIRPFQYFDLREQSRRKASLQHRLDPPNRHNPARKCLVGQGGGDKGTACGSERGLERPAAVQSNS